MVGHLEGLIYDCTTIDELPDNDGLVELYGLDFGFTNDPTACVKIFADTRKRELYLDQVIYQRGLLNRDIADRLEAYGVPKRGACIYADCAEPKSIAELCSFGYNVKPCYKASKITEQIAFVQGFKLYITKRSLEALKECRGYVWQTDKDGNAINVPTPFNDHAMDAMRYGVFTALANFNNAKGARAMRLGVV